VEVFVRNFFLVEVRVGDIETISYIILANLEAAIQFRGQRVSAFSTPLWKCSWKMDLKFVRDSYQCGVERFAPIRVRLPKNHPGEYHFTLKCRECCAVSMSLRMT
jgi:hypothetical protein